MKRISFLSIIFVLLVSCAPTTGLPSVEPSVVSTSIPLQITQTHSVPTLQATNTAEPMIFKVAEFGRGYIFDHALSPDGKTMAIASSSGLYLYDVQTQEVTKYIKSENEDMRKVVFSSDGNYLVYHGNRVRVLSLKSGEIILETDKVYITNYIGFNSDDQFTAFTPLKMGVRGGYCNSEIEIWNIESGKKMFFHDPPEDFSYDDNLPCLTLSKVAFNQDNTIVFVGYGGGIVAWETSTGKQLFYMPAYSGIVTAILYDADLDMVVTGDSGGAIRYWNAKTGEKIKTLGVTSTGITSIKLSNDKKQLIVDAIDQSVTLVDYKTGRLSARVGTDGNDKVYADMANKLYKDGFSILNGFGIGYGDYTRHKNIAYSKDGNTIATGCTIIDSKDGRTISILSNCEASYRFWGEENSYTGKLVAIGNDNGEIKTWDVFSSEITLDQQTSAYINTMAFSGSESLLAVGTDYVSIWDAEKNKLVKNFYPGTGRVEYVGFRDNDQRLVVVTVPDYLISIFDIHSGKLIELIRPPLPEQIYEYSSVVVQGNYMAASGTIWNMETNSIIKASDTFSSYNWLTIFSPDGRIYLEERGTGVLLFIDMKTQEILYVFDPGFIGINPIFSSDGKNLSFIVPGGTIQIWDISRILEQASP